LIFLGAEDKKMDFRHSTCGIRILRFRRGRLRRGITCIEAISRFRNDQNNGTGRRKRGESRK